MNTGYITRAHLRPDNALAAILQAGSQADAGHKLIWTLFPGMAGDTRPFLFREDPDGGYLIVSDVEPIADDGLWRIESKPYAPVLKAGDKLSFTVRVNPAVRPSSRDKKNGHVDAIMHAKHALLKEDRRGLDKAAVLQDWLAPRLVKNGARLDRCDLMGWQVRRLAQKTGGGHNLGVADLEGRITIEDPAAFSPLLFNGLGRAKAFGCGLLLVRRLRSNDV